MRLTLSVVLLGTMSGCGAESGEPSGNTLDANVDPYADAEVTPDMRPDGPIECFGTVYPGIAPIDPDNPVYSDAEWTQQEVTEAFAEAKAGNTLAYKAYKAAYELGDILECAFCACGCEPLVGHLSATDCFKDMHGFG